MSESRAQGDPEKAYLVKLVKGKPEITRAQEWTPISAMDLKRKPDELPLLMIDDILVSAEIVPLWLATVELGEPIKGEARVAVKISIISRTKDRKREYTRWVNAKLTDDKKNTYDQIFYRKQAPLTSVKDNVTRIDGDNATDMLFFEKPVAAAKTFYLELLGENVGIKGNFKLNFTSETLKLAEAMPKSK